MKKKLKFTRFPYDLKKKNYISYPLIIKCYFLNADLKRLIYFFHLFCEIKMYFYHNIGKSVYLRDLFK